MSKVTRWVFQRTVIIKNKIIGKYRNRYVRTSEKYSFNLTSDNYNRIQLNMQSVCYSYSLFLISFVSMKQEFTNHPMFHSRSLNSLYQWAFREARSWDYIHTSNQIDLAMDYKSHHFVRRDDSIIRNINFHKSR